MSMWMIFRYGRDDDGSVESGGFIRHSYHDA